MHVAVAVGGLLLAGPLRCLLVGHSGTVSAGRRSRLRCNVAQDRPDGLRSKNWDAKRSRSSKALRGGSGGEPTDHA
jgi:hypothetical protein